MLLLRTHRSVQSERWLGWVGLVILSAAYVPQWLKSTLSGVSRSFWAGCPLITLLGSDLHIHTFHHIYRGLRRPVGWLPAHNTPRHPPGISRGRVAGICNGSRVRDGRQQHAGACRGGGGVHGQGGGGGAWV